jgi:hypothetical protein
MMNSEDIEKQPHDAACAEIKLYTAKDLLKREASRIEVPENTEMLLSPSNREFASYFSQVEVKSYEDLQLLGFVPRRLSEEKIRQAITADDDEVYKVAYSSMSQKTAYDCNCGNQDVYSVKLYGTSLRTNYNNIRKKHNPALARLLSDHLNTQVAWDDPLASVVRKWAISSRIDKLIYVVLLEDIIINRNATLAVAANTKSLLAHNIWIHQTGRLVKQGSYLKIWANSINTVSASVDAVRKIAPPWLIAE